MRSLPPCCLTAPPSRIAPLARRWLARRLSTRAVDGSKRHVLRGEERGSEKRARVGVRDGGAVAGVPHLRSLPKDRGDASEDPSLWERITPRRSDRAAGEARAGGRIWPAGAGDRRAGVRGSAAERRIGRRRGARRPNRNPRAARPRPRARASAPRSLARRGVGFALAIFFFSERGCEVAKSLPPTRAWVQSPQTNCNVAVRRSVTHQASVRGGREASG